MGLFERDYNVITEEEIIAKDRVIKEHTPNPDHPELKNSGYYRAQPKAIRHHESLFPNNFLDVEDLQDAANLKEWNQRYIDFISMPRINELDIKRFIQANRTYHIIGSIMKNYRFGHHGAFLFKEFKLGTSYTADYVLVGDSSNGYQFIFVECEHPNYHITIDDGEFGEAIRKGINQINDWKDVLNADFSCITSEFKKHTTKQLPDEFYRFDSSRFFFVVVAGLRADFTNKTYRLARKLKKDSEIDVLHYENLYDLAERIIGEATY